MKIIIGLGNIGREYENTRHNAGFMAIDKLAQMLEMDFNQEKFSAYFSKKKIDGEDIILLKPTTYMNLSGDSIREVANFYKLSNEEIIVLYDDISLAVGRLRVREKGSHGGHNGIKSIIANLATDVFPRVKIGVGAPKGDLVSHVLGKFSKEENEVLDKTLRAVTEAVEIMIDKDTKEAMNKCNGFDALKCV